MAAIPGRDLEAEALLYRNLAPRARLYGLRHLRDAQSAADLAQEVLIMTLRRLREGSILEPERIVSFVLGACRQLVVDWRRGQRRRDKLLEHFSAEFSDVTQDAPPPDLDQLRRCMECLPERERSVLLLSFFEERCANEIACELKTSTANIRVIRHRGIEKLRNCMNRERDA